jgi:putative endonuclease
MVTGLRERKKAHGLGIRAERVAVGLLRLKGYRILACRYQTRDGEIDIVARRHGCFCRSEGQANSRRGSDRDRRG